jgi:hypothetical protein
MWLADIAYRMRAACMYVSKGSATAAEAVTRCAWLAATWACLRICARASQLSDMVIVAGRGLGANWAVKAN